MCNHDQKLFFENDRKCQIMIESSLNEPESDLGRNKNSDLAVLGPQVGPDRPNFKSYSHITALQPVGTVPGPPRLEHHAMDAMARLGHV